MKAIPRKTDTAPYTALAAGYDLVMAHVDYDLWAEHIHELIQRHHPDPRWLLELGCGTGSFALKLQPHGAYHYTGTDGSSEMIRVACRKAELDGATISFSVADFTNFQVETPVDVVVLLYDGLNYLLEKKGIRAMLRCAYAALRPGGIFLFDQSTPANSLNNEDHFEDQGGEQNFDYTRYSRYDAETRLHTTTFDLRVAGRRFREEHVQRAYTMHEIRALIQETDFEEAAAYDNFLVQPATKESERIHWILRRPIE